MWSLTKKLKAFKSGTSGKIRRRLKKSLWHYFNPSVNVALEKIFRLVDNSKQENFILGIIHIENMASIIFSYGDAISVARTKELQPVIKKCLGKKSKLLRVSIDEFLYVCPYDDEADYNKKIELLTKETKKFGSKIQGTPIFFSLKIGAALMNKSSRIEMILDNAFIALYECRNNDTMTHCLFSQIAHKMQEYKQQIEMAAFFQKVISTKRLQLAYQPVICSKTGKVKSYEALLRLIDDNGTLVSAGPYVSVFEKYGYITEVDRHVLRMVVKELKMQNGIQIGMNVSSLTIEDKGWLEEAKQLLAEPSLAERLIVEITETGIQRQIKKTIEFVETIQSLGCQVAIDDFGAGYTSFSQLKLLDVDILKIDGIFIKDIHENVDNQLFVKTLLEFARAFGIKTVAEFVESGDIAKVLIDLGVDYLQGYYFDKPLNHRPWITKDS